MAETVIYRQSDLFNYCKKLRMEVDKRNLEKLIESNKRIEGEKLQFQDHLKNFWKGTKSTFQGEESKKNKIQENETKLNAAHDQFVSDEYAHLLVKELFGEQNEFFSKFLFAVSVIIDNEIEYVYRKEGLIEVSKLIFNDEKKILEIEEKLKNSFKEIAGIGLTDEQRFWFLETGLASYACMMMLCLAFPAGAAATTGAAIAGVAVESLLLGGVLLGAYAVADKIISDEKLKQEFRSISPNQQAMFLAVRCVYLSEIKENVSTEEFKQSVADVLESINLLKNDLDQYYFVEGEDLKNNKKKEDIFHRFDNHFAKIVLKNN